MVQLIIYRGLQLGAARPQSLGPASAADDEEKYADTQA